MTYMKLIKTKNPIGSVVIELIELSSASDNKPLLLYEIVILSFRCHALFIENCGLNQQEWKTYKAPLHPAAHEQAPVTWSHIPPKKKK